MAVWSYRCYINMAGSDLIDEWSNILAIDNGTLGGDPSSTCFPVSAKDLLKFGSRLGAANIVCSAASAPSAWYSRF